ncbi:antibiotic biosynthesis monooxygenase [Corynebacterium sp.]|uniref:antibiotic biosynthesis monooxygenase family protein n=1 Tax=Corynebacterium sp. TaxID=1720 RepID=UPI0026DCEC9B|nr:antibiotic biosynthesis monooxygenase [Corynebacterium sp.]MDO4610459.1 antibiotic biosynthesis monooxygenase [Corynebacterium sp.]
MSIVKINAIEVPQGAGEELERRFAAHAGHIENQPGFEGFQLLRPTGENETRYFVVTRWVDEAAYEGWRNGQGYEKSHPKSGEGQRPVATGSALLEFDVVVDVEGAAR